jgi:hypothetical protein
VGIDTMDEMIEAIYPKFNLDIEDLTTSEVEEFFRFLKA